MSLNLKDAHDEWVKKFGEEQAKYLQEEMSRWTQSYSQGVLIDFDFLKELKLKEIVAPLPRAALRLPWATIILSLRDFSLARRARIVAEP